MRWSTRLAAAGLPPVSDETLKTMPRGFQDHADGPLAAYLKGKSLYVTRRVSEIAFLTPEAVDEIAGFAAAGGAAAGLRPPGAPPPWAPPRPRLARGRPQPARRPPHVARTARTDPVAVARAPRPAQCDRGKVASRLHPGQLIHATNRWTTRSAAARASAGPPRTDPQGPQHQAQQGEIQSIDLAPLVPPEVAMGRTALLASGRPVRSDREEREVSSLRFQ